MGFCRRCGDIVVGARCHCGGLAVAPVVSWGRLNPTEQTQDKWSKTYVSRDRSPTRIPAPSTNNASTDTTTGSLGGSSSTSRPSSPMKKFPRPMSSTGSTIGTVLGDRVSTHIATTTSQLGRPPSPLKQSMILPAPESNIIPSLTPQTSSLAKVYGSVLQPKDTLETHSCAICATDFPPDATIYPDPSDSSECRRFLCRACFISNGGSKGICPSCSRPVLILKAEGGFVFASGSHWHKKCFNCDGCGKNLGDSPMVDLLGRPSCADCFDGCLKRDPTTPKKHRDIPAQGPPIDNPGGMRRTPKGDQTSQSSPTIEELEQRLGIAKSRESSPTLEELEQRLSMIGKGRESPTRSPLMLRSTNSKSGSDDAVAGSPLFKFEKERGSPKIGSPFRTVPLDASPSSRQRFASPDRGDYWDGTSRGTPSRSTGSPSPVRNTPTRNSPAPTEEAIEEMKQRFLRGTSMSPASVSAAKSPSVTSPPPSTRARIDSLRSSRSSPLLTSKIPRPTALSTPQRNGGTSPKPPSEVDSAPPTPDLVSDFTDTISQSSGPDSPPNMKDDIFSSSRARVQNGTMQYSRGDFLDDEDRGGRSRLPIADILEEDEGTPTHTPIKRNVYNPTPTHPSSKPLSPMVGSNSSKAVDETITPSISESQSCARCNQALFSVRAGGRYVTVPEDPGEPNSEIKTYHVDCFRCYVCNQAFKESGKGQATFVKGEYGPCHLKCAPPEKVTINYKIPQRANTAFPVLSPDPEKPINVRPTIFTSPSYSSSRYERPPQTAPPTQTTFPRFGTSLSCPGCRKSVSPMERGVVPGPQGTRWHATCLVCGGKKIAKASNAWMRGRGVERNNKEPGCGKKLDSAAKGDGEGGVWCRECWLMLPLELRGSSPQASPVRSIVANPTGNGKVASQMTGTTTIARQFTGVGAAEASLIRQMTGGGLSPTRQLSRSRPGSPTKQLGLNLEAGFRPRPKSVIGMRGTKSVDEGRGMFLVRQMTGSTAA